MLTRVLRTVRLDTIARRSQVGVYKGERTRWYEKSVALLAEAARVDCARNQASRERDVARGRSPEGVADLGNYWIYHYLCLAHLQRAHYGDALDAFTYVRRLAPDDPSAYRSIARGHIAAQEPARAVVPLLQALALNRDDPRGPLLLDV